MRPGTPSASVGGDDVATPLATLSLFSGGGGLDLGVELALAARSGGPLAGRAVPRIRTVAYVEREAYAAACLLSRMEENALVPAPVWANIVTFDARPFRGLVDLVVGGSPCQDLSVAGKRAGLDGAKSGLFWHFARVVEECQPGLVFWENVGGARSALRAVFDAFESRGYVGAAVSVRASDVGASHERARLFLLAYRDRAAQERLSGLFDGEWSALGHDARRCGEALADSDSDSGAGRIESGRRDGQGGRLPPDARDVGEAMANSECDRVERRRVGDSQSTGSSDSSSRRGEIVVDASSERIDSRGLSQRTAAALSKTGVAGGDERPCEWPPGPDDDAWRRVIRLRPDLAPSQPGVRGVADGVASGLVDSLWTDRLRLLGNGVVPQQAAAAFLFLAEQLGAA